MTKSSHPHIIYQWLIFTSSLLFSMMFVVTSLYEAKVAQLSGLQLVLVGTMLEVTVLIFEIPTGIVADAYSRRISIIIGYFIMGLAFMIEGFFPYFGTILLASALWGLGHTFTSGATEAWLSDEIGEEKANLAILSANKFRLAGSLGGMLLAIPLGNISIALPIYLGGACLFLIGFWLLFFMPENHHNPTRPEDRNTFQHMGDIFFKGLATIKSRPTLQAVLGVGLIYGLYSEGWDRLWVKYLVDNFSVNELWGISEVTLLGIIKGAGLFLSLLVTHQFEKRVESLQPTSIAKAMLIFTALLSFGILCFAFSPFLLLSIVAIWIVSITREMISPLYSTWVNQRLSSETRATVISMSGQVDALGQIASGPLSGLVSLWSMKAAIGFAGLLITPALPLIFKANTLFKNKR